ncbi:MAG TPA: NAD(P)-dependent oxidoreductase, partial [archaeon]|nr:NAD(P)-dependent oxidoreductase [archaeon]
MRVLVTGGTGLVGAPLVERLLRKGHEVFVLGTVFDERLKAMGAQFVLCDVMHFNGVLWAFERVLPDVVYHLAATLDEHSHNLFRLNVGGTRNVLQAVSLVQKRHALKLFVYPSSIGILSGEKQPIDESAAYAPKTKYERSKMEAELFVLSSGLPYCVVRSTILIGPNEAWASIARAARKNQPVLGSGDNAFHLADYRDFVDLLALLPSRVGKAK